MKYYDNPKFPPPSTSLLVVYSALNKKLIYRKFSSFTPISKSKLIFCNILICQRYHDLFVIPPFRHIFQVFYSALPIAVYVTSLPLLRFFFFFLCIKSHLYRYTSPWYIGNREKRRSGQKRVADRLVARWHRRSHLFPLLLELLSKYLFNYLILQRCM